MLLRVAEMLLAATALAVLAWLLGRTRWVMQRPAVAAAMWMLVLVKAAMPWGPHFTWHYAAAPVAAVPLDIMAQINTVQAALPFLWWHGVIVVGLGLWLAVVLWRLLRRTRASHAAWQRAARLPVADHATQQRADRLANAMLAGLRAPDVRIAATATTPFCVGAMRPIVVVPLRFVERPGFLQAALAHEFAHLKRRDLCWRVVQLFLVDLLWFFPIAHVASRRVDAAREAACDAMAVAVLHVAPSTYGAMLVEVAANRGSRSVTGIGMAGNGQLRSRLAGLALPRNTRIDRMGAVLLTAWFAVAAFSVRAHARRQDRPCQYSAELAKSLLASHPEADVNADAALSRDEVCGFEQARATAPVATAGDLDERAVQLLASMCCNWQSGGGTPSSSLELGPQACVEGAP